METEHQKLRSFDWNTLAVLWLFLPVLVMVAVDSYAPRQMPDDPLEQVQIYKDTSNLEKAETILADLLQKDPLDLELNVRYIQNHCDMFNGFRDIQGEEKHFYERYQNYTQNTDSADIGYYGLGLIESCRENYQTALNFFLQVDNGNQKYINNSIGYAYKSLEYEANAEFYLQREILLNGNMKAAVTNLADLYKKQGAISKLRALVEDELTKTYAGLGVKGYAALRSGQILRYLEIIYIRPFGYINGYAALCALLICSIWFVYLWRINSFSLEPLYIPVLLLLSGAVISLSCFLLHDLWYIVNPISEGENTLNDFIFFVFHVGVIEEMVKFIPVIFIVLFLRKDRVNDSLDLVVYGGISALGFATLENSLYFSVYGIRIVPARFIVSTVLHMAETMLLCFIWARARYIKPGNEPVALLTGFCLVALSHGMFDFIIISQAPLFFVYVAVQIGVLAYLTGWILNHCITLSPRSSFIFTSISSRRMSNTHLLASATAILMIISYLYNHFKYATEAANLSLAVTFFITLFAIGLVYYPLINVGIYQRKARHQLKKKLNLKPVKPF